MIKYIFFDVAGTLLHKPSLYSEIHKVLKKHDHLIDIKEIKYKHKFLSEVIHFPDRTDSNFYKKFNSELLLTLGIVPNDNLLDEIFNACSYLPWKKFDDAGQIEKHTIPKGIISNFNSTLRVKLDEFFDPIFDDIFVSEELGVAKPNQKFYEKAISQIDYKPEEILYIGDSMKLDVVPAQGLGLNVLLIDRDKFYNNSPFKINSLNEITNFIL